MSSAHDDDYQALALAAHELRSPASVVVGYLRLLLKGDAGALSDTQRKMLDDANQSCGRILHLVRELSDLAALKSTDVPLRFRPLAIFALCDEVVRASINAGAEDVVFSCPAADRPAIVNGDAERLKNAFGSLIGAIQRERGTAVVEAHGFVGRTDEAAHAIIVFGSTVGASPERNLSSEPTRPFERWRGGMGMALPIACSIIEGHGGRVWAIDSDSTGATALSVPLANTA